MEIDDTDFPLLGVEHEAALTRGGSWVIRRAQKTRLIDHEGHDFALVPDVVTSGDDRRARPHQSDGDLGCDAAPTSCIFAVHDSEIDLKLFFQQRQQGRHCLTPRLAHHISEKKDA